MIDNSSDEDDHRHHRARGQNRQEPWPRQQQLSLWRYTGAERITRATRGQEKVQQHRQHPPTGADPNRNFIRKGRTDASTQLPTNAIANHGKWAKTRTAAENGNELLNRYRIATQIGTATIEAINNPMTTP